MYIYIKKKEEREMGIIKLHFLSILLILSTLLLLLVNARTSNTKHSDIESFQFPISKVSKEGYGTLLTTDTIYGGQNGPVSSYRNISGNFFGMITPIRIGNTEINVLIDTGSSYLIIPKQGCQSCSLNKPFYEPSQYSTPIHCASNDCKSISRINDPCNMGQNNDRCYSPFAYSDGTKYIAEVTQDVLNVGNRAIKVIVGGIISDYGAKIQNMRFGIMGIGRSCPTCPPNLIDSISRSTGISNVFGLKLENNYNGIFTVGKPVVNAGETFSFTPINETIYREYVVNIDSISFDAFPINTFSSSKPVQLQSNINPTILDSGTGISYFTTEIYYSIVQMVSLYCSKSPTECSGLINNCFVFKNPLFVQRLPVLNILFSGGARLSVPPEIYTAKIQSNIHCTSFIRSPNHENLIGLSFMKNNYVLFDNENNQIGFLNK
ncbi:hypothetical protein DFA_01264 [Cavenderia fasciculata]|uniref:Peptidase A1 domain-containing protein n=1 Tax=Cavenderia fasciculata TaxID=261658 RepID=F4PRU7_CACFS|nr:uncharacterized protein DFA_01264 [Cavenderia fasciculata]EGG21383.1 hypothetical protein DFA_01264 [Cavenderia fasciculata]|eukprot:XP_004359233.1 hypothetical protein DFA_01264 [Cavenderia fasciculata]